MMQIVDVPVAVSTPDPRFRKISGADNTGRVEAMHHGHGAIDVQRFAFFGERQTPYFIMLDLPPGSSEGEHAHGADTTPETRLDEYYYVISGAGIMSIEGEVIDITQGDFIYTPAGVSHGIANTAKHGDLKVMLTVISVPPA